MSKQDLMSIHGVGDVKAVQILAICELSIRLSKIQARMQLSFHSPDSIARYFMNDDSYFLLFSFTISFCFAEIRFCSFDILQRAAMNFV